ncbi:MULTISPECIES: DUF5337 domain-containing protein [Falsihalocynthiibacter]|uniref:DUF5337 domain-containing protein n=1 Tax=Falsihalocynthiibacter arcticus TaxID=1579316 RepID=A0A126V4F3_9RHOB|nr:DUF5337 domain-containing protein [Falsihalocynthiibacter arcticus]AML53211.1 hypothetical protein RC74_19870 [Falsihalocynthiibacter arcticus]
MVKKAPNSEGSSQAKSRLLALVIAGSGIFWVVGQALGTKLGWTQSTRLLIDLFAMAGFFWGLVVGLQIWRARQG